MTTVEAEAFVKRAYREIRADLEEPGYLTQNTVDRLATELVAAGQCMSTTEEKKT